MSRVPPSVVFLFLDTEFTSLESPELISLGISSSDESEFYFENLEFPQRSCSAFVRDQVLPKLGFDWGAQGSVSDGSNRLGAWLHLRSGMHLVPVYDYADDLRLFMKLVPPVWHTVLAPIDAREAMSNSLLEEFVARPGVLRHHALHDARALAFSCSEWATKLRADYEEVQRHLPALNSAQQLAFWRHTDAQVGVHPLQGISAGMHMAITALADEVNARHNCEDAD